MWIVDDDCPWLPTDIDQGQDKKRLDRFKAKLGTHTTGTFSDVEGFHQQVAYVLANLRQKLDQRLSTAERAPTSLESPHWLGFHGPRNRSLFRSIRAVCR